MMSELRKCFADLNHEELRDLQHKTMDCFVAIGLVLDGKADPEQAIAIAPKINGPVTAVWRKKNQKPGSILLDGGRRWN